VNMIWSLPYHGFSLRVPAAIRLALAAAAAFLPAVAETRADVVRKAFAEREIVISTPDGPRAAIVIPAGRGPRPTMIVLHGATMTADSTIRVSGFAEAAAGRNFTAVFPQGLRRQWHDGRAGGPDGPDDVAFLRALADRLIEDNIAPPGHVYIAGVSNGGMMSFTMACKVAGRFRGVGTVIANMPAGIGPCDPGPVPLVMINGTSDPMVPYVGGSVGLWGGRGEVWSVEQTAELFVHRNGCRPGAAQPLPHRDPDDGTSVTRFTWSGCRTGKPVTLYRIEGGGHQIAGRRAFLPMMLGRSNRDFSAAEAILSAFAREEAGAGE
jgi:polyhydroxybutyrate depolymerase